MYFVWGTYTADELILERFGLRHTNTWGTHHVIWLTNICIFPKVDRWGRIYFDLILPFLSECEQYYQGYNPEKLPPE